MDDQKTKTEGLKVRVETNDSVVDAEKNDQIVAAAEKVFQAEIEFPELGDRFQVIEFIGAGGMGRVYKVKDIQLDKTLAVKLLRSELASDAKAVQRFRLECDAVSNLSHPNVVSVYEFHFAPSGIPFILMDFVDGLNLQMLLIREGPLEAQRARRIMEQVSSAVGHAHGQGVLHRDLKPSNIIVRQDESGEDIAVVLDFGIAAVLEAGLESSTITRTGELVGSPQYMSPEQLNGETVSKASDVFSLGCLFYEMLVGEPAFADSNPVTVIFKRLKEPFPVAAIRRLKPEFTGVISACLETSPGDRYQSVEALSRDLAEIGRGKSPPNMRALKIDYNYLLFARFLAFVLDGIIIWIVATITGISLNQQFNIFLQGASLQFFQLYFCFEQSDLVASIGAASVVLYYVLFEASRLRATPGKRIMNLAVASSRFEKLPSIVVAIMRYASKVLFTLALFYGVLTPIDNLGLKPLLPFVNDGVIVSIILLLGLTWILRKGAQLPHDVLIGTRVVPTDIPPEKIARVTTNNKPRLASAAIAMVLIPISCVAALFAYNIWDKTHTNNSEIAKYTLQLQTDSNNPRLWNKRGRAYMDDEDYDRAVADFTRSLELSRTSESFDSFGCRGYCYRQLREYSKALSDLQKARALAPDKSWIYFNLSDAENNLGLYKQAKQHATTGIEVSSRGSTDLPWLHNNRAVAENALGEYAQALTDAERASLLGGGDLSYLLNKGHALYGLGDYYEAARLATRALAISDNSYKAYWLLGLASHKCKDTSRALAYIDRAGRGKASVGFKSRILASRGDLLFDLSRYDDAIKAYDMAIELRYYGPHDYEVFESRAQAYERIGNKAKADADRAEAAWRKKSAIP